MGQRTNRRPTLRPAVALLCLVLCFAGCSRQPAPPATQPASQPAVKTVASLVPAATDLLIAMGAADRIVGVSTYDADPAVAGRPRVGDYQIVDWEQLAALRPSVMVVQYAPDRMPPGLAARARGMGIAVVNVKFERLEDVFVQFERLGEATDMKPGASLASERLRKQLDTVRSRVAEVEPVPTFLALDSDAQMSAGPGTYLDDVLRVAGGRNVLGEGRGGYPQIDRETLISLKPAAVVQLMPDAPPQAVQKAERTWAQIDNLPAVRDGRVYRLTDSWVLQPGSHVGDLAEAIAERLHPAGANQP